MMKDLARGLTLAALALCVVSSLALAQDPVPGELEDLDALLGTAVSTGAKYDQTTR